MGTASPLSACLVEESAVWFAVQATEENRWHLATMAQSPHQLRPSRSWLLQLVTQRVLLPRLLQTESGRRFWGRLVWYLHWHAREARQTP